MHSIANSTTILLCDIKTGEVFHSFSHALTSGAGHDLLAVFPFRCVSWGYCVLSDMGCVNCEL